MNSDLSSVNIPGLGAKTPFTVLAVKRSDIIVNQTAAKATAALRRKALVEYQWPSSIGRQLYIMHDGGFNFYITWPDELDQEVLDLELTGSKKYPAAGRNLIHKFVNNDLTKMFSGYESDIGWVVDQFVVGVF